MRTAQGGPGRPAFATTTVTRALTGRPARALRNRFTDRFDRPAPAGYPAPHHLTGPLRKAATAAGDTRLIHLWARTGHREARAESVAAAFERSRAGSEDVRPWRRAGRGRGPRRRSPRRGTGRGLRGRR
ncbi:nitronate monooxygenase [Streptomyces sp. NPDC052727]|uniref:nitronate monooxygenase n=1 Tax=Streptomyces sp. NPDC052727 TaxID=3154854 RepID=UPI003445E87C